ncbi:MAG: transporter substrate-binding domain-containing protein [Syntrophomonadaceae bacterium]|nr:transporter substrate-binding domain-containing protein [Syntrophomonadaceae bacterium]
MKRFAKLLLVVLMVLAMGLTLAACGGETDVPEPPVGESEGTVPEVAEETDGTFRVGMECGYAPFNWTQMDDSKGAVPIESGYYAGGYDVEIAKILADSMNKELVIVKTDWEGLIPALQSGTIDAVIAGMSPTAERKESIDFSSNYYKSDLVMVVRADSEYAEATSIQDFSGAKVTAQLGTFHYTVIPQIEGVEMQTAMESFPAMRVALESGVIDGYVSERPEGVSATTANPNFAMVSFEEGFATAEDDVAIAVGLLKGSELLEPINAELATISLDQQIAIMDQAILDQPAAE